MDVTLGPSRWPRGVLLSTDAELDLYTAGSIAEAPTRASVQAPPVVVLDLTCVESTDGAALRSRCAELRRRALPAAQRAEPTGP